MRKRLTLLAFMVLICAMPAFSVDLSLFGQDFKTLANGIGDEMLPALRSASVSGLGLEDVQLGKPFHIAFTLDAGAVLSGGLFSFVDSSPSPFKLLDFNNLIDSALGNSSQLTNLYDGIKSFFPYPVGRISVGLGSIAGFDTLIQFSMIPQGLTNWLIGLANIDSLKGTTFNTFNVGARIRRVLVADQPGFPGIAIGLGYVYSYENLGYDLSKAGSVSMAGTDITFQGNLVINSIINSAGINLVVYKKFLGFLKLSAGIAAWEQWTYYEGGASDFDATITGTNTTYKTSTGYTGDPIVKRSSMDLTTLLTAAIDFEFGGFQITINGQYDPANNLPTAGLGLRFVF